MTPPGKYPGPFMLLLLAVLSFTGGGCGDGRKPPNIILLSIDTLRADHLSCYGYFRDTSPWIDRIAYEGVRFEHVVSHAPSTAPSHMSIFTSTYPGVHGVKKATREVRFGALPDRLKTLTELLKERGYRTAAFTGGAQVTKGFGFERGFEVYEEEMFRLEEEDFDPLFDWLAKLEGSERFFLFLHTYQVHSPYCPPPPYHKRYDPKYSGIIPCEWERRNLYTKIISNRTLRDRDLHYLRALYDGEIRYTDDTLAKFFEALKEKGHFGNGETLLVITSDHGEEFLEHGMMTHMQLYREVMEVPLILHWPGRIPGDRVVKGQVRLLDIAPTIFDLIGIERPVQMQGSSLKPYLLSEGEAKRTAFSENLKDAYQSALRVQGWTYYDKGEELIELYATDTDREEKNDLLRRDEQDRAVEKTRVTLQALLMKFQQDNREHCRRLGIPVTSASDFPEGVNLEMDKELEERLRTLGYLK